jgi:hypothetical protein
VPAQLVFFVNAPAILHDILDKLSILKKHLHALPILVLYTPI